MGGKRGTLSFWWSIVVILVEGLSVTNHEVTILYIYIYICVYIYRYMAWRATQKNVFFFRRRNCGCSASSPANRYNLAVTPRYLCDPCMAQSNSWQEAIHLLSAWRHREAGTGWDSTPYPTALPCSLSMWRGRWSIFLSHRSGSSRDCT